jgi:uncharacterized membrane protein
MSRWDSPDIFDSDEESRLLRKFYDYAELEKKESERRRFLETSDKKMPSIWGHRFVLAAMIQGAIVTGLIVALILVKTIFDLSLTEFLSPDGYPRWFFFGFFMYVALVAAVAITAMFYNHLETNLGKPIRGKKRYLVWTQLIGMNVGGGMATMLLVVSGFIGNDLGIISDTTNTIESVKIPIAVFSLIFAGSMVSGGLAYAGTYKIRGSVRIRPDDSRYNRL